MNFEKAIETFRNNPFPARQFPVFKMNDRDFESWIKKVFEKEIDFRKVSGCREVGKEYEFEVTGSPNEVDVMKVSHFLYGDLKELPLFTVLCLLDILCVNGFIPKGLYLITILE